MSEKISSILVLVYLTVAYVLIQISEINPIDGILGGLLDFLIAMVALIVATTIWNLVKKYKAA